MFVTCKYGKDFLMAGFLNPVLSEFWLKVGKKALSSTCKILYVKAGKVWIVLEECKGGVLGSSILSGVRST